MSLGRDVESIGTTQTVHSWNAALMLTECKVDWILDKNMLEVRTKLHLRQGGDETRRMDVSV